jgi:hypothetical protein
VPFKKLILCRFPGGCSSQDAHEHGGATQGVPVTEDMAMAQQEALQEQDDPETLARQRAMDEYKDEHRRGEGNRFNRS